MKNKPILTISTDWHIKKENIEDIKKLIIEQCELSVKLGVKYLVCLGDVFESRVSQREDVLKAFKDILDIIHSYELKLIVIPGNHDKTNYDSIDSFLLPYEQHPAIKLVNDHVSTSISDVKMYFIPFFNEGVWVEEFDKLTLTGSQNILFTHIAVTGSVNNDGTHVSSSISPKLFSKFNKVFSGHYHDQQKIGKNFYHLPSIQQNNFGENSDKGFTVLYDDLSHELVKSTFKEFIKVKVDLDTYSQDDLNTLKRKYGQSNDNVRFEFIGSDDVLKSIKKEDFTSLGIDIKTKSKEIVNDIEYIETVEIVEHNKDTILEAFKNFCEKENYSYEQGVSYLQKKLK